MRSKNLRITCLCVFSGALFVGSRNLATVANSPAEAEKPSKKTADLPFTISKETTSITKPLRSDGSVDYVAALNSRLSEGVTPENNAAVLLMQVMGSGVIEPEIRQDYYRLLEVPVPESTEGALQSYWEFLGDYLEENEEPSKQKKRRKELNQQSFESYGSPWKREQFPLVARWLETNEETIDLIVSASKRPRLYVPIVPMAPAQGLVDLRLEFNSSMRDFGRILAMRIMFSIGEGEIIAAQRDLIALHRLARFRGNGSSVIDFLVGIALEEIARAGDLELAKSKHVTSDQLAEYRVEIAKLPDFARMSKMYDLNERYGFLDLVQTLVRGSLKPEFKEKNPAAEMGEFLDWPQVKVWKRFPNLELNWDLILKIGNSRFDEVADALKQPKFEQRIAALSKIEAEIMELRKQSQDPREIERLLSGVKPAKQVISRQFAHELAWITIENAEMMAEQEARTTTKHLMHVIALALAKFQRENGEYPEKLSELSPRYLKSVPQDGFTGKPFKYQRQEKGYLLYSVGANGKDDKGQRGGNNADDLHIRAPGVVRAFSKGC